MKFRTKNKNKGFTLVELIVTIAVLGIIAAACTASYTSVMENQRKTADMTLLGNLDLAFRQILLTDEAFAEVKDYVYDNNKVKFTFVVSYDTTEKHGKVDIYSGRVNGNESIPIGQYLTGTYRQLTEHIGKTVINLDSNSYEIGYYEVYVEFNGSQVSSLRPYVITNDGMKITNSGSQYLRSYD